MLEVIKFSVGVLVAFLGALLFLMVLAIASMTDAELDRWDWWAEFFGKIYLFGLVPTILARVMIGAGVALSIHSARRLLAPRKPRHDGSAREL